MYLLCLLLTVSIQQAKSQEQQFTLSDIINQAITNSPSSKQAETRKENRYWQYRFFKSNYNPQLRLGGNIPGFRRDVLQNRQDDGTILFQGVKQTNSLLNLGLNQPLALTGGEVSVNTNLNYFDDLDRDFTQWSGTVVNVNLDQPLFAFNTLKWDKKTEPIKYEESKREYVEEMEFVSQQAVDRFFAFLDAQINLQIAAFNRANNDTIYKIEQGRYNLGTTSKDKLLQVELQLLRSRQDVAQAKLDQETAKLRLNTFVGLTDIKDLSLVLPEDIPEFDIDYEKALELAKSNRADYIAFERRRLEAAREVAEARGRRFQANLNASYGLNNAGTTVLNEVYADPVSQQRVDLTFSIPVIDWGRNKARMKTALANQRLNDYIITQDEVNFEQEILTQVRRFEMLKNQIEITKVADKVAQERYNVAQNRYLIGKIDITNLNIALTEKDNAKRSYVSALRTFWNAYYELRRLTLYDFTNDSMLYNKDDE